MSCIGGVFVPMMEFLSEQETLQYIEDNEQSLLIELLEQGKRTLYDNGNTKINVKNDGKRLIKIIYRFEGDKNISDIYRDMVDLRLM